MKRSLILFVLTACLFALFILPGCNGGGDGGPIPVDKEKAKQHIISIKKADDFRNNFAKGKEELRRMLGNSNYLDTLFDMPVAEMFNRDAIALLLNQKGAEGVRIYLGRDENGDVRFVLLPVDKNGKDIRGMLLDERSLTQQAATQVDEFGEGGGQGIEVGQRCPTMCN